MKVVITGGGGFIGSQLAKRLSAEGSRVGPSGSQEKIDTVLLFDSHFPESLQDNPPPNTTLFEGDLSARNATFAAIDRDDIAVFHLAAMVSGECEERFDDALSVNLNGTQNILEALRAREGTPRVVFASSVGTYGGEEMPDIVGDFTKQTHLTNYGMSKVLGEQLIND